MGRRSEGDRPAQMLRQLSPSLWDSRRGAERCWRPIAETCFDDGIHGCEMGIYPRPALGIEHLMATPGHTPLLECSERRRCGASRNKPSATTHTWTSSGAAQQEPSGVGSTRVNRNSLQTEMRFRRRPMAHWYLRGRLDLRFSDGESVAETRTALCTRRPSIRGELGADLGLVAATRVSPGSALRIKPCSVVSECARAFRSDESQHPMWPQPTHIHTCTHLPQVFKHNPSHRLIR